MAHFAKADTVRSPFGKNQYLRSTQDVKYESYTFGKNMVPSITIDGDTQKVVQPGTVIAKATAAAGADQNKVGVYQATTPTDGRQTAANIVGILDTFLPWELLERDADVSVAYEGAVVQAWCLEYNAAGAPITILAGTVTTMLAAANMNLLFK
jgi:hypothetical protein